ncbi:MAG: hypothetical protein HXY40_07035 [Chloroflexi bacterium]|nr:hypothetical protein [Chloroflexota bacterium]
MSSLTVRRIFVWVVGMLLGFAVSFVLVTGVIWRLVPSGEAISVQDYGYIYFLVTAIPIGIIFVAWLDGFMDTKILPD